MASERKIVFYCSASRDIDQKFNQAAREAARAACSLGYTIVSGGTVKGTMGELADEVVRCGGRHVDLHDDLFLLHQNSVKLYSALPLQKAAAPSG